MGALKQYGRKEMKWSLIGRTFLAAVFVFGISAFASANLLFAQTGGPQQKGDTGGASSEKPGKRPLAAPGGNKQGGQGSPKGDPGPSVAPGGKGGAGTGAGSSGSGESGGAGGR